MTSSLKCSCGLVSSGLSVCDHCPVVQGCTFTSDVDAFGFNKIVVSISKGPIHIFGA